MATLVEGDSKALFSIATREGATPFHGLLHFTLDPCLIMLNVMQGSMKYHFCMTRPRIENQSPVGWLFGFYGISNFVRYLTPNPFL